MLLCATAGRILAAAVHNCPYKAYMLVHGLEAVLVHACFMHDVLSCMTRLRSSSIGMLASTVVHVHVLIKVYKEIIRSSRCHSS